MKMAEITYYNSEGQTESIRIYCKDKVEQYGKDLVKVDDSVVINIGESICDVKTIDRELPTFEYRETEGIDCGEAFEITNGLVLVQDKVFQLLDTLIKVSADGYICFHCNNDSATVLADTMSPTKRLEFVKFLISELPEKQRTIEQGFL